MTRRLIHSVLAVLCAVLLVACQDQEAGTRRRTNGATTSADTAGSKGTASVAGSLQVPEGINALGVMVFAQGTSYASHADDQGRFVLSGLPPGRYVFRAMGQGLEPTLVGEVEITEANTEAAQPVRTLDQIVMKAGPAAAGSSTVAARAKGLPSLIGIVVDGQGNALENVRVDIEGTNFVALTNQNGYFTFSDVPDGRYSLTARTVSGATATGTAEVAAASGPTLIPPVQLAGATTVVAGGSQRMIFGQVQFLGAGAGQRPAFDQVIVTLLGTDRVTTPDVEGNYQFQNLELGAYSVGAQAPGFLLGSRVDVDLTDLEVARVNLRMLPAAAGTGALAEVLGLVLLQDSVTENYGGVTISLLGTSLTTTTDRLGQWALEGVPPGTYDLRAEFSGYRPVLVEGITLQPGLNEVPPIEMELDVEAPRVVRTIPPSGADDVTIEEVTLVLLTFSQPMDPASLLDAISVSPTVDGEILVAGQHPLASPIQAVIALAGYAPQGGNPIQYGTNYQVTVSEAALSAEGVPMERPYSLTFRTGKAKVIGSVPQDGRENVLVSPTNPIRFYVNAPLRRETLRDEDIQIRPDPGFQPRIQVANDPDTGWSEIVVSGLLNFGTEYTVTLRGGAETLAGQRLSNLPYRIRFRTVVGTEYDPLRNDGDELERIREERGRQ